MPGGIHRGVPTAPGSFFPKREKKGEEEEKRLSSISMQKRILPFLSTLKYVELFLKLMHVNAVLFWVKNDQAFGMPL